MMDALSDAVFPEYADQDPALAPGRVHKALASLSDANIADAFVATIPEIVGSVEHSKLSVSLRQYFNRHVQDQSQAGGPADSVWHVGLKTLENVLCGNSHVKMIHTRDDFLLNADDRDYLDDALGDRITWFSAGAHCGMFYTSEFKQEVLERLNCYSK